MSSGEQYGAHPHDRLIASIIFESFGISQGREDTHIQALRLYAILQPQLSRELLTSLNERWHDPDIQRHLAGSLAEFMNRDDHPNTPFKTEYASNDAVKALGFTREGFMRGATRPNITEATRQRNGLLLGRDMLSCDYGYLSQPHGRGKPESAGYSLLKSSYNSHWMHYAYVADPEKIPESSIRQAAVFAARSLHQAIEARDTVALRAAAVSQSMMSGQLSLVVNTHLQHYPQHADVIPTGMLLDRAADTQFAQGLIPD